MNANATNYQVIASFHSQDAGTEYVQALQLITCPHCSIMDSAKPQTNDHAYPKSNQGYLGSCPYIRGSNRVYVNEVMALILFYLQCYMLLNERKDNTIE